MELLQHLGDVRPTQMSHFSIRKRVKTEIMFGNPSTSCQGVGICRVLSYGQETACKCPKVTAWISVTEEGKLRFSFLKTSIEKQHIRKHFGWRLFQVYTAYELSDKIARKLGLEAATVRPGIYTVWETPRHLVVDF